MNLKRAAILAVIFLILSSLYFFLEKPTGRAKKEAPPDFFSGFQKERAAAILITSPEKGKFTLKKHGSAWKVFSDNKTFTADTPPIDKLLDSVSKIKAETVASKNPKNFAAFEVTEGKGIEVKIDDDSENRLAHFFVGKSGPDIFSTYVREKDKNRVILTSGILKNIFEKELKDWRDKTIFNLPPKDITEYRVEGDLTISLKKDEKDLWQATDTETFAADKETAEKAISGIASLKAADFAEGDLGQFQLDKPRRTITVTLKNAHQETLFVGKEKNAFQNFVKAKGRDTVFVIENIDLLALCPPADKLRPEEKQKGENQQTPVPH